MDKRSRIISETYLGEATMGSDPAREVLEVRLSYGLGGMNFFTGTTEPRGYYLHVSPITKSEARGFQMTGFTLFSGIKKLVQPAARFSEKTLASIEVTEEMIAPLREHVLAKRAERLAKEGARA